MYIYIYIYTYVYIYIKYMLSILAPDRHDQDSASDISERDTSPGELNEVLHICI